MEERLIFNLKQRLAIKHYIELNGPFLEGMEKLIPHTISEDDSPTIWQGLFILLDWVADHYHNGKKFYFPIFKIKQHLELIERIGEFFMFTWEIIKK